MRRSRSKTSLKRFWCMATLKRRTAFTGAWRRCRNDHCQPKRSPLYRRLAVRRLGDATAVNSVDCKQTAIGTSDAVHQTENSLTHAKIDETIATN